jgi:mercuric ion transport protein
MDIKKVSSFGGAIAAIFASICCLGPLILAGLGAGAGTIAFVRGFGRFHNFFIVLTVVLFLTAFWFIYLKRGNPEVQCECCSTAKKEKIILWVSIAVAFTLLILPFTGIL